MPATSLILIGASAGGMPALARLLERLPADIPAAVLAVQHFSPDSDGQVLAARLARHTALSCRTADSGAELENGAFYLARPDRHLLVSGQRILITRGAHENRYRPSVDALFRSAAASWGQKVTGVILTGMLHDGTTGLEFIKRCGGLAVVQDPSDAEYPSMPATALSHVRIDHVAMLEEMGPLLAGLAREMSALPENGTVIPEDLRREAAIALRAAGAPEDLDPLGDLTALSCPDCGGSLWEMRHGAGLRYRCHTGHAFSAAAMLEAGKSELEKALWTALRMMEEHRILLSRMEQRGEVPFSRAQRERLEELQRNIAILREFIVGLKD